MEDTSQLAVAPEFYKYTLTQRESNKIEGLLDARGNVHNVRGGGRVQNAQNILKPAPREPRGSDFPSRNGNRWRSSSYSATTMPVCDLLSSFLCVC